jgi:hypothetical protein
MIHQIRLASGSGVEALLVAMGMRESVRVYGSTVRAALLGDDGEPTRA